jgi:plastocyanin
MRRIKHKRAIAAVAGALCCAAVWPVASGAAAGAHQAKAVVQSVSVADDYYGPAQVTINKGSAVNFVWKRTNYDSHNVTLIKAPKGVKRVDFTSVTGAIGIHFKRTFLQPGTYHFVCTIHPGTMNLTVVVKK